MAVYKIEQTQFIPITLDEAWHFFSSPKNLDTITPPDMTFKITSGNEDEPLHAGQIITYKVSPFAGIKMFWLTEITHVVDRQYFVDEQRFGPYTMWHHRHFFEVVEGGVKMRDVVYYKLPLGFLGDIAHAVFVKKKLQNIFGYRYTKLEELFGKWNR